ncbi:trypsin-1-like protein [Dinothrombium tinctorium]|uniref:Trypsin-1-like protein n=1 Tax=Dinothrombium tinctorium TaxID=1965070 RepID=A0A3S3PF29_9ACAR|nr:trypsin-1-like protein [Dinothrombium tinctorium]
MNKFLLALITNSFLFLTEVCSQTKCKCGSTNIAKGRIINGRIAEQNTWPWITAVMVFKNSGKFESCGGTLIDKRFILTAAHCFPSGIKKVEVLLGGQNRKEDGEILSVKRILTHDDWKVDSKKIKEESETKNDIALVELKDPVKFNLKIKPICLPPDKNFEPSEKNATVIAAGWGRTDPDEASSKTINLMETNLTLLDWKTCNKFEALDSSQICAWSNNSSTCKGDSGGPLAYKHENRMIVIGITSYGNKDCVSSPTIFTKVAAFLEWIITNGADPCR